MSTPGRGGVRNIVHGYQRGDEFPTWLFAGARCVFVYTKTIFALSRGNILGTRMYGNKYITIYIYSYVYKYINIYIYRYIFSYKNIVGLYNKAFFFPLKFWLSKRE